MCHPSTRPAGVTTTDTGEEGAPVLWFAAKTPTAYDQAHNRAVELWALLGTESDPAARQAVYLEMAATYNRMAGAWVPDDVPGGYDGDFAEDLADMAALCWVLAASEEALVSPGSAAVPLQNIPGAAASSAQMLAERHSRACCIDVDPLFSPLVCSRMRHWLVPPMRTTLNFLEQRNNGNGCGELPPFPGNRRGPFGVARRKRGTILCRYGCDHCNGRRQERSGSPGGAGTRDGADPRSTVWLACGF